MLNVVIFSDMFINLSVCVRSYFTLVLFIYLVIHPIGNLMSNCLSVPAVYVVMFLARNQQSQLAGISPRAFSSKEQKTKNEQRYSSLFPQVMI